MNVLKKQNHVTEEEVDEEEVDEEEDRLNYNVLMNNTVNFTYPCISAVLQQTAVST